MKKFCLFLILLICMAPIISCTTEKITIQKIYIDSSELIYSKIYLPSVKVIAGGREGSGTIINNNYILTANHIINDYKDVIYIIIEPSKKIYETKLITSDEELDYAILSIIISEEEENKLFLSAELSFSSLKIGDKIYIAGYPLEGTFHINDGYYCGIEDGLNKISADVIFGESGGGVYNNEGKLVGIIHGIKVLNGVIPVYHISYFKSLIKIKEDLIKKDLNILVE